MATDRQAKLAIGATFVVCITVAVVLVTQAVVPFVRSSVGVLERTSSESICVKGHDMIYMTKHYSDGSELYSVYLTGENC